MDVFVVVKSSGLKTVIIADYERMTIHYNHMSEETNIHISKEKTFKPNIHC